MANRDFRPVMFALEPDVCHIYGYVTFGAAGAPTLTPLNSKGLCNISLNSISITGTTSNSSTTVSSVSSFSGLYPGMSITGTNIPASTTISSMSAGGDTITLSQAATGANTGLTVSGGQYTVTFGTNFALSRLDPYVRLLYAHVSWDESGKQGGASTLALAPAAPAMFIAGNNISSSTLANLILQFGSGAGTSFVASNPNNGDIARLYFAFTRSTAI